MKSQSMTILYSKSIRTLLNRAFIVRTFPKAKRFGKKTFLKSLGKHSSCFSRMLEAEGGTRKPGRKKAQSIYIAFS